MRVFIEILAQFLMKLLEDYSGPFQVFLDGFVLRRGNALAANEEHTEVLGNHVEGLVVLDEKVVSTENSTAYFLIYRLTCLDCFRGEGENWKL